MSNYLLLSHIKVHNANALSSALTVGFPAMTAFLGFVHHLERLAKQNGFQANFAKVAVCSHAFHMQHYKHKGDDFYLLVGTGNPLNKDGNRPSFNEEARCKIDLSLLIECKSPLTHELIDWLEKAIQTMKLASGDILSVGGVNVYLGTDGKLTDEDMRRLKRKVMPGFWLTDRSDLVRNKMSEGQDALSAVLEHLKVTCTVTKQGNDKERQWEKKTSGWIIPISVGFHALTPEHYAVNQRDKTKVHRFAEAIVTLGEFKMPHRISSLEEILWGYLYQAENNLYLCKTRI